jgi:hypothetical protein
MKSKVMANCNKLYITFPKQVPNQTLCPAKFPQPLPIPTQVCSDISYIHGFCGR